MSDKNISSDIRIKEFITCEFVAFGKVLDSKDDVNILKFHLLFENMLEKIIVGVLKRGDRLLDKGNLSFLQKLMLVYSFDIISDSYIQALGHLNSLHNKLSHAKETMITLDDLDIIGRPLGKSYANIKRKYKNDHLLKAGLVAWDTFFLIYRGLVHQVAVIEFGKDDIEKYIRRY